MEYCIDILAAIGIACSVVFVFLPRRSQPSGNENVAELLIDPNHIVLSETMYSSTVPAYVRFLILADQSLDLVLVGVVDVLFAPSKVRMHLTWEECILGNVGVS